MRELNKIITVKPEPETTPSLSHIIQREKAVQTVSEYFFTAALRGHFKRIFDCVSQPQGPGLLGAGGIRRGQDAFPRSSGRPPGLAREGVWDRLSDAEIKNEYAGALSKVKLFPVAFSLRGMGQSGDGDSLMRVVRGANPRKPQDVRPGTGRRRSRSRRRTRRPLVRRTRPPDAEKAGVKILLREGAQVLAGRFPLRSTVPRNLARNSCARSSRRAGCEENSRSGSPTSTSKSPSSADTTASCSSWTNSARGRTATRGYASLCRGRGSSGDAGVRPSHAASEHHHDHRQPGRHAAEALRRRRRRPFRAALSAWPTRTRETLARSSPSAAAS